MYVHVHVCVCGFFFDMCMCMCVCVCLCIHHVFVVYLRKCKQGEGGGRVCMSNLHVVFDKLQAADRVFMAVEKTCSRKMTHVPNLPSSKTTT